MQKINFNKIENMEQCKIVLQLLLGCIQGAKTKNDFGKLQVSEQILNDFPILRELL